VAVWFGPETARAGALRALRVADRYTISELVILLMHDSFDLPLADTVARFLLGADRTPDDHRRGAAYRLVALAGQGRWPEAVTAWERAAPPPRFDAWMVQAYLAGYPAVALATPMLGRARVVLAQGASDFALPVSDERQQAVQALAHRATLEGDSAEVLGLLQRLTATNIRTVSANPMSAALQASLRARLAVLARDTAQAIGFLERALSRNAGPYTTFFPLSAMAPQRLLLAELLVARGDHRRSDRWLDSFSHSWSLGDVLYALRVRQMRLRSGI
jgi:hypothetical protein